MEARFGDLNGAERHLDGNEHIRAFLSQPSPAVLCIDFPPVHSRTQAGGARGGERKIFTPSEGWFLRLFRPNEEEYAEEASREGTHCPLYEKCKDHESWSPCGT
jgi:hypothetical protein